jgi:hypothetical protein
VSVFRRRRRGSDETDESVEAVETVEDDGTGRDEPDDEPALAAESPAGSRRDRGPWDIDEVVNPAAGGRVDLGGVWLPGRPGLEVRIEADQATSQVVAVTLVLGDSALQVQPFAAPRTETIWDEVRDEIRAGITKQGGTADEVEGPLGTELRTKVPVRSQDGSSGVQPARFVGVDGPRWFLRGVLTGRAAVQDGADAQLVELFRDIVVVRGDGPMAPRDPIPLALPPSPGQVAPAAADAGEQAAEQTPASQDDLKPFQRGPEITEIR